MEKETRKPFNLEEALAGKPFETRNGIEIKDWHYFKESISSYPIVCLINRVIKTFTTDGILVNGEILDFDLFMKPEEKTLWFNVYQYEGKFYTGQYELYDSQEDAKHISNTYRQRGYISTHSVTIKI